MFDTISDLHSVLKIIRVEVESDSVRRVTKGNKCKLMVEMSDKNVAVLECLGTDASEFFMGMEVEFYDTDKLP